MDRISLEMAEDTNVRRTMWIDDELWAQITALAQEEDRTVSSWIRRALIRAVQTARRKNGKN